MADDQPDQRTPIVVWLERKQDVDDLMRAAHHAGLSRSAWVAGLATDALQAARESGALDDLQ